MDVDLATIFERARVGRVLTIFANDVEQATRAVQGYAEELDPVPTFVQLDWDQAPELTRELREIAGALAEAVRTVWPGWHRSADERFQHRRFPLAEREIRLLEAQAAVPQLSTGWFREAFTKCSKGELPLIAGMPLAEQVHQLTLALDPTRPIFCLSVKSEEASEGRVHGLARACEWLAKQSQASVLLFVPANWTARTSLDPVNYEAVELFFEPPPRELSIRASSADTELKDSQRALEKTTVRNSSEPAPVAREEPFIEKASGLSSSGPVVSVFPVPGKPHPLSDCEKHLLALLQADQELAPLFEANQRVLGFGERFFRVDLLWAEGLLVIELDGDEHRALLKYRDDRERDYRLFLAGYATLRVTNHEVIADSQQVVEKIRKMTRCRARQQALSQASSPPSPQTPGPQTTRSSSKKSASRKRKPA